jgi:hypothetical protein
LTWRGRGSEPALGGQARPAKESRSMDASDVHATRREKDAAFATSSPATRADGEVDEQRTFFVSLSIRLSCFVVVDCLQLAGQQEDAPTPPRALGIGVWNRRFRAWHRSEMCTVLGRVAGDGEFHSMHACRRQAGAATRSYPQVIAVDRGEKRSDLCSPHRMDRT